MNAPATTGTQAKKQLDGHLVAKGIAKRYRDRQVLSDVDIEVNRGEAVGLLGPNGAGKTTTFYIVTGLIAADQGKILLDGEDITNLPMYRRARRGIGYLPQEASVFKGLSVEDNILAALELSSKNQSPISQQLQMLLEEFGLDHIRNVTGAALSGGERRRCEIARAIACDPSIILLDEPLAGVDPVSVVEIRELVGRLKDRGIGVLITDHNVRDMLGIIDRAYILHQGKLLREGTPEEIVADPMVRQVYLGERFTI